MPGYFSASLLKWFSNHGRHNLPWQHQPTPYHVWISEIMLQQTQVATVIPYFNRFIKKFPDIQALAGADIDQVLSHWSGLGYYARGRYLHHTAQIVCARYDSKLPADKKKLMVLPGIGRSTASAILALAFGQTHAILDGNVKRVLARFYAVSGWTGTPAVEKKLWQLAENNLPQQNIADYTQAIMDLGAIICTRSKPECDICPVSEHCIARKQQAQQKYPAPRPRKTIPLRKTNFLLLKNDSDQVLFHRRPPTGIWGGLWCFPECSEDENIEQWLLSETGFSVSVIKRMPVIKHTLTHFRMEIQPVQLQIEQCQQIRDMDNYQWHLCDDILKYGVPVPVRKLLLKNDTIIN